MELPGRLDAAGWGLEGLVNRDTLREERELNVSGMIDHPRPCLAEAGKREELRHSIPGSTTYRPAETHTRVLPKRRKKADPSTHDRRTGCC